MAKIKKTEHFHQNEINSVLVDLSVPVSNFFDAFISTFEL